jgi:hypothetical protein
VSCRTLAIYRNYRPLGRSRSPAKLPKSSGSLAIEEPRSRQVRRAIADRNDLRMVAAAIEQRNSARESRQFSFRGPTPWPDGSPLVDAKKDAGPQGGKLVGANSGRLRLRGRWEVASRRLARSTRRAD